MQQTDLSRLSTISALQGRSIACSTKSRSTSRASGRPASMNNTAVAPPISSTMPSTSNTSVTLSKRVCLLSFAKKGHPRPDLFLRRPRRTVAAVRAHDRQPMAQAAFTTRDDVMARRLVEAKEDVRRLERQSAERHVQRLRDRRAESIETSSLHLDMLRDLKRIKCAYRLGRASYPGSKLTIDREPHQVSGFLKSQA